MPKRANSTSFGAVNGNDPRGTHQRKGGDKPQTFRNRMALLASRAKTVQNVETILDDAGHRQFTKMFDLAASYGYGKPVSAEDVKERVADTIAAIRRHTTPEQASAILEEIRPLWR